MKKKKDYRYSIAVIFIAILLLIALSATALASSVRATINSSSAKVYQTPSTSAASVNAAAGLTVTVAEYSGGWAKIGYKGRTGYIKVSYLNLKDRIEAYACRATSAYSKASSSSAKLASLTAGTKVYIIGMSGDYARIQNRSGSITCYVDSSDLASKSEMESLYAAYEVSGSSSSVENAVKLAVSYVGRPYGNNEPSSFNCSSLVEYCFEKYGYSIKSSAKSIAEDSSLKKISTYSDCKCGDILCFDSDGNGVCDHVAIYIDNGYFVEASQDKGKVQINTMSSWYKSHCMWARRV